MILRCAKNAEVGTILNSAYDHFFRLLSPPPPPPPAPRQPSTPPPQRVTQESIDAVRQILEEHNVDEKARGALWLLMEVDRAQAIAVTFKLLKRGRAGDAIHNPSDFIFACCSHAMHGGRSAEA